VDDAVWPAGPPHAAAPRPSSRASSSASSSSSTGADSEVEASDAPYTAAGPRALRANL
jgi:hypothetical protein